MRPAAQIQTAIELLEQIEIERRPADRLLSSYYRDRRYIGSKDKASISETVYAVLRQKGRLMWFAQEAEVPNTPRSWIIVLQLLNKQDVDEFFTGEEYTPGILNENEANAQVKISHLIQSNAIDAAPIAVRFNIPEWLVPQLQESLEGDFETEMQALQDRADLCVRVNTLKTKREDMQRLLQENDISSTVTKYSPWGLTIKQKVAFNQLDAFKQGLFEVQDQGSQLIALITQVKAGQKVVDFCAGAGGKSLAMAAQMNNKGVIHACDVHTKRLENLTRRKKRAGVHNIQLHVLSSERDKWVKRQSGKADVVLIDAPCTGTGTWRRSPDARWNLEPQNLEALIALQANILTSAARLVKPGGKIIYATCSLLKCENEDQIQTFLTEFEDFEPAVFSAQSVFSEYESLNELDIDQDFQLRTSPAKTGMDGFFMSVLQRKKLDS